MRTIAASNEKGGVGKTTSAVNIAHGLALRGRRVLLIDADSQGNCAPSLGITEKKGTLAELLLGQCSWREALIPARPGLDLIPSGPRLAEAKDGLIARLAAENVIALSKGRPPSSDNNFLAKILQPIKDYDYLIIDCAPSRDILNMNAIRLVKEVLMPVSVDYLATIGAGQHMMAIREAQEVGAEVYISYVVPTFFNKRTIKSREILTELHRFFGNVVTEPIPANVSLAEAPSFGQTIFEYAPHSSGAIAYTQLVEEICRDEKSKNR